MLAAILPAIYAIPSRLINPLRPCVVSLGHIQGGATTNVIPNEILLEGTIRSHHEDVRQKLWAEIENALRLSTVMGGSYELKINKGYPALFNAPEVNGWMRQTAQDLVGSECVRNMEFGMGAEDFAYMAQETKGAMFMLGAATPDASLATTTPIFSILTKALSPLALPCWRKQPAALSPVSLTALEYARMISL